MIRYGMENFILILGAEEVPAIRSEGYVREGE